MQTFRIAIVMIALLPAVPSSAQQAAGTRAPLSQPEVADSPAQQRIAADLRQLTTDPRKIQAISDLATAYLRRARETSQRSYLLEAGKTLDRGLALESNNFALQRTQVALLLARSQFALAKEKATALNRRMPDDVMTYGYLAEADLGLGNYWQAERSTQWMLNLRPNNVPGLLLAATLRETYGDADGALELLNMAYAETSPTEVEDLAWIANRIAAVEICSGRMEAAAALLDQAEQLFPRYAFTMENRARVSLAENQAAKAVDLLGRAALIDSDPHVLYALAQAQRSAGQTSEALVSESEFRRRAESDPVRSPQVDHDLVLLDTAAAVTRPQALALAERTVAARHDVLAEDAYAWALSSTGRYSEAEPAIRAALEVGVQSAEIFDHAGHIAQGLERPADAAKYFELSLRSNPTSPFAWDARASLHFAPGTTGGAVMTKPAEEAKSSRAVSTAADPIVTLETSSIPTAAKAAPLSFATVPTSMLVPLPTSTERRIHTAQMLVSRNAKDAKAYAALGAAFVQRARETGDVSDYQKAEQALTQSLNLGSADFSADAPLESLAEVCMGEHRFTDALTYSDRALSLGSGDLSPFAIVGDAYADMGEYAKASLAYDKLSSPLLPSAPHTVYARDSRVSYLMFINGDTQGAIGLMRKSIQEGIEAQLAQENLAWLYYELGEYLSQAGDAEAADAAYVSALTIHPGDYRALAGVARLRANHGRYAEAIQLYQRAIAVVPMPIFVAELGDVYAKTGNMAEAQKQYQLVEYIGLLGTINQVLHNRDLALFYADHDRKLPVALALARKEFEVRHDIYTWDALAWALFKNGKLTEANEASRQALRFGTRDALLLYHAGVIAESVGEQERSKRDLTDALAINPNFHLVYAKAAQERLRLLDAQAPATASLDPHAR